MMGLPFSWRYSGDQLLFQMEDDPKAPIDTHLVVRELVERVEVLYEAAERARLVLHGLPERLDEARDMEAAWMLLAVSMYEAESSLYYAIFGEEMRSEEDEGVSVDFPKVSERSRTLADILENGPELTDRNDSGTMEA